MRPTLATLAAATSLALAAAPASARAQASPAAPPPTIDACYVPASGTIYRISTTASPAPGAPGACLSASHVRFTWNQQGPRGDRGEKGDRGDTGARGPTGPQGPQGPEGAAATLQYQRVSTSATVAASSYTPLTASCPSGKKVVAGGVDFAFTGQDVFKVIVHESYPVNNSQWRFGVSNALAQSVPVTLYVVCL